ncbi:hypothetical protein CDL15_Pgr007102 [Punica granatum]|uniref:Uncharacterized protein n=1 Tax=Punica granatum TaxID=22663 RepID=A0A218X973_PUNGR|nr:hypothetical protein CDL15_Pgr007102 [Punica granatum]
MKGRWTGGHLPAIMRVSPRADGVKRITQANRERSRNGSSLRRESPSRESEKEDERFQAETQVAGADNCTIVRYGKRGGEPYGGEL